MIPITSRQAPAVSRSPRRRLFPEPAARYITQPLTRGGRGSGAKGNQNSPRLVPDCCKLRLRLQAARESDVVQGAREKQAFPSLRGLCTAPSKGLALLTSGPPLPASSLLRLASAHIRNGRPERSEVFPGQTRISTHQSIDQSINQPTNQSISQSKAEDVQPSDADDGVQARGAQHPGTFLPAKTRPGEACPPIARQPCRPGGGAIPYQYARTHRHTHTHMCFCIADKKRWSL